MRTKSLKQTVTFNATPDIIYQLIMDQDKHSAFTDSDAIMSTEVNGKFSVFDGYCRGYNIELKEGEKIVQSWHFAEEGWPDDHFSTCTFLFEPEGNKTKLRFLQTGIPEDKVELLKDGWKQFYWQAIKKYLKTR